MSEAKHDDPLFDFILYLVTSARVSLDERAIYGSFRLIEGASRLIEAAGDTGVEGGRLPSGQAELHRPEQSADDARKGWLPDVAYGPGDWIGVRIREAKHGRKLTTDGS